MSRMNNEKGLGMTDEEIIAELHKKIGMYQIGMASEIDKRERVIVEAKEQLAKAKGIIKNLLDVAKFYNKHRDRGAIMDITPIYDAEQFLKELENEKRL